MWTSSLIIVGLPHIIRNVVHTFKDVNAAIHYDSKDRIDIDFSTGNWAEPWKGAVSIFKDRWIWKPAVSTYDLNLGIRELNPSSLGTGLNIHETVTASAAVTGKIA